MLTHHARHVRKLGGDGHDDRRKRNLMSITTRTGDNGTTGLMYNRRVAKYHPRVEAYGEVDELNAVLGLARCTTGHRFISEAVEATQKDLILLMGELATIEEDLERYLADGFQVVNPVMTESLDRLIQALESQGMKFRGWSIPGASPASAHLELARTVCRRAERSISRLERDGQIKNPAILMYLNRLSDALWLLARWEESQNPPSSTPPDTPDNHA